MSERPKLDWGTVGAWVAIAFTAFGGATWVGSIDNRVASAEESIKDAKPIAERLATLEANQKNTETRVGELKTDVQNLDQTVQRLIIELQRQRETQREEAR